MSDVATSSVGSSIVGTIHTLSVHERLELRRTLTLNPRDAVISMAVFNQVRNRVGGDYLEFGVWRGASLALAYHTERSARHVFSGISKAYAQGASMKRFIGFDSFQGLPAPSGDDVGLYEGGDYAASLDEVRRALEENDVELDRTLFIEGFFEDSLTDNTFAEYKLGPASIIHIDVDYYTSTKCVLDFVSRGVVDGTIIIFDDWFLYRGDPRRGQQKAAREWLNENPQIRLDEYMNSGWSKAFLVRID